MTRPWSEIRRAKGAPEDPRPGAAEVARAVGLDVERLRRAVHAHHVATGIGLHAAGEGWCGEEADAIAAAYLAESES